MNVIADLPADAQAAGTARMSEGAFHEPALSTGPGAAYSHAASVGSRFPAHAQYTCASRRRNCCFRRAGPRWLRRHRTTTASGRDHGRR